PARMLDVPRRGVGESRPWREVAQLAEPQLREPHGRRIARPSRVRGDRGGERGGDEGDGSPPAALSRRPGSLPAYPRRAEAATRARDADRGARASPGAVERGPATRVGETCAANGSGSRAKPRDSRARASVRR